MAKDIQEKKEADLRKELTDKREALRLFRFGSAGTRVKNVKEGREMRRNIARILTELKRRTLEEKA
jgi:ribosomal protein L29